MRPSCECCDRDLDPSGDDARICSFECTWCVDCAAHLDSTCPNCGGPLLARPPRPVALLEQFPAKVERTPARSDCPL